MSRRPRDVASTRPSIRRRAGRAVFMGSSRPSVQRTLLARIDGGSPMACAVSRPASRRSSAVGVGTVSSSINHTQSNPSSYAWRTPAWKPPAPPSFVSRRRTPTRGNSAPIISPVPSSLALSTTRIASGARVWASSADRHSRSISLRSWVTTTAQTLSPPSRSEPASGVPGISQSIPLLVGLTGPERGAAAGQGGRVQRRPAAQERAEARALLRSELFAGTLVVDDRSPGETRPRESEPEHHPAEQARSFDECPVGSAHERPAPQVPHVVRGDALSPAGATPRQLPAAEAVVERCELGERADQPAARPRPVFVDPVPAHGLAEAADLLQTRGAVRLQATAHAVRALVVRYPAPAVPGEDEPSDEPGARHPLEGPRDPLVVVRREEQVAVHLDDELGPDVQRAASGRE